MNIINCLKAIHTIDNILINNIKELDRIKTKDGRVCTVMDIWFDSPGLDVEFDNNAS